MAQRCLSCGHTGLLGNYVISGWAPLAANKGTIKVGGLKIGQINAKVAYDLVGGEGGVIQRIRGPIKCENCETEHYFLVGDKNPLRMGSTAEARRIGYENLQTKKGKR